VRQKLDVIQMRGMVLQKSDDFAGHPVGLTVMGRKDTLLAAVEYGAEK
jgi:hypothetical protein